jgi:hypothetical protein
MPEFESYVDVDPSDFVSACSKREIKELIECLTEDGYLKPTHYKVSGDKESLLDIIWNETLDKLSNNRLMITNEEEEIITKIANRL